MTTPSQTIGPFFHLCLTPQSDLGPLKGQRIRLVCRILDGDGTPANDAMIEIWQADAAGEYGHFARVCTNKDGICTLETVKPGRVGVQAPHINVMIFARGLLKQLFTRIYFEGDPVECRRSCAHAGPRGSPRHIDGAPGPRESERLEFRDSSLRGIGDCVL